MNSYTFLYSNTKISYSVTPRDIVYTQTEKKFSYKIFLMSAEDTETLHVTNSTLLINEEKKVEEKFLDAHEGLGPVIMANEFENGVRTYRCSKCHYMGNIWSIKRHLNYHWTVLNWKCEICGKIFKLKNALKQHEKYSHESLIFDCSICGEKFSTKFYLRRHAMTCQTSLV